MNDTCEAFSTDLAHGRHSTIHDYDYYHLASSTQAPCLFLKKFGTWQMFLKTLFLNISSLFFPSRDSAEKMLHLKGLFSVP